MCFATIPFLKLEDKYMTMWGLGFISLGLLLITYRQGLIGFLVLGLGVAMFFVGRRKEKENATDEKKTKK